MDLVTIEASLSSQPSPAPAAGSGAIQLVAPLCESLQIAAKIVTELDLITDSPVAIPFAQLTGANLVYLKLLAGQGSTVKVTHTSDVSTNQNVPMDDLLILVSQESPLTAISLTRTPGAYARVEVLLGQSAS